MSGTGLSSKWCSQLVFMTGLPTKLFGLSSYRLASFEKGECLLVNSN